MSQWDKFLASGVDVPPGGPFPLRQDFTEFSEVQKFLYFEGLKRFQSVKSDDPLSYYQIAGIHGLPYDTWPNKEWNRDTIPPRKPRGGNDPGKGGFCTHSSILFLTWHRPYLALYESTLYKHVNDVANSLPTSTTDRQAYIQAAQDFRIPYWDWAKKENFLLPEEALDPKYRPKGPKTSSKDYNPLYEFPFLDDTPNNIKTPRQSPKSYGATVRYVDDEDPQKKRDNMNKELRDEHDKKLQDKALLNRGRNLTERVAWVLQAYDRFAAVSTNRLMNAKDGTNYGSMEDFHNSIHGLVGDGGHMNFPEQSAFDPVFWLHHTNIDRLFCIWQALNEHDGNPNSFVTEEKAGSTNYARNFGDPETLTTPLYPFRYKDKATLKTEWYDSSKTARTEAFGYSYPETVGLQYPVDQATREAMRKKIGKLYAPIPDAIWQSRKGIETAGQDLLPQAAIVQTVLSQKLPATAAQQIKLEEELPTGQSLLTASLKPGKPLLKDLAPDNKYLEWMVNIKAEKHTEGGTYSVHVFLGPQNDEPQVFMWPTAPTYVGEFYAFGQANDTECAKCQGEQRDGFQITGQIPLTIALAERYLARIITDLSEDTIVPYLTKNLHWRVSRADGTAVANQSDVKDLTVSVISNEVTLPGPEGGFPRYSPTIKIYPEITTNQDGAGRGNGTGLTADVVPSTHSL